MAGFTHEHPFLSYRNWAIDSGAHIELITGGTYTGEDNILDPDLSTYMEITAGGPIVEIDLGRDLPVAFIALLISSGIDNSSSDWGIEADSTSPPPGGGSEISSTMDFAVPDLNDVPDQVTRYFRYWMPSLSGAGSFAHSTVRYIEFQDNTITYTDPVRIHLLHAGPVLHPLTSAGGRLPTNGGATHGILDQAQRSLKVNGSDFFFGGQVRRRADFRWRFLTMDSGPGTARDLLLAQQNGGGLEDGFWMGNGSASYGDFIAGFCGRIDVRSISPHDAGYWEAEGSIEERI